MKATTLARNMAFRGLITGFPGAGKTGSLACLANAGFKLRIVDFDGNPEPLYQYCTPEGLANIDILSFEDQVGQVGNYVGVKGLPVAFTNCLKALDKWTYKDEDGTVVDLGSSATWGPDTIVVVDGLTGLSAACFAYAQAMMNKTPFNTTQAVWGLAISNQINFIRKLTAASNRHHVIMLSHLKMIGPKAIEGSDDMSTRELKERLIDLVPTRYFPTALGQQLPQTICGEFPIVVNIEAKAKGTKVTRSLNFLPREDMDLKLPVSAEGLGKLDNLGLADGMLRIFDALGIARPNGQAKASPASAEGVAVAAG